MPRPFPDEAKLLLLAIPILLQRVPVIIHLLYLNVYHYQEPPLVTGWATLSTLFFENLDSGKGKSSLPFDTS